jgi:hypothetical protein
MSWLPQFTAPQWVMIFLFLFSFVTTPSDDVLQRAINKGYAQRFAERAMSCILWICLLGWAGFWS